MTVDAYRDPNKKFGSDLVLNFLATLRTNHAVVWVIPCQELQPVFGVYGRHVTALEKCRLLGICAESVKHMDSEQLNVALGNCIAIPSAASVLCPLLAAWALMKRDSISQAFFSQASSSPASSDEDKKSDEANDSYEDKKSEEAKDGEAQQDNKDDEAQDEPSDSQKTNFYDADFTGR